MVKKRKTGLGKGLSALLRNENLNPDGTLQDVIEVSYIKEISVGSIQPNQFQPRKGFDAAALEELKQSIIENGIIQPLTVRKTNGGFELITGERRLRASKLAGLDSVPVYIMEDVSDEEMLEYALVENIQRENLNPIEAAHGYQQLIAKCNLTQEEVAVKIGKNRTTITNFIRLLKLPEQIRQSLINGELSAGHGRALINLPSEKVQLATWGEILKKQLSVRKTEEHVRKILEVPPARSEKTQRQENLYTQEIESQLRLKIGTKVRLKTKGNGGVIEIEYYSNNDLQRLIEVFESINT